jgi:hypothetical protein
VSDSFPYEWIKKKWREGFFVTAMATANTQWAVIMSRTQGILSQVIDLSVTIMSRTQGILSQVVILSATHHTLAE